tara:strand:- start:43961 stop:44617 length:657 start_codon:yes stop_codon:yes gene_type:complete
MNISHSKKFIYIHIPKTAGTSVSEKLMNHSRFVEKISQKYFITRNIVNLINRIFKLHHNGNTWINGLHKHSTALDIQNYLGLELYSKYFKFSFVRNPYDLVVSHYIYIKRQKNHKFHQLANKLSLEDYWTLEMNNKTKKQHEYLTDFDDNLIVDFIGKFENLDEDFEKINKILDINCGNLNILNKSNKEKTEYHFTQKFKDQVYEYYKKDFELFGYKK